MSDYIVTSNGLLPADELVHSAKGTTWSKDNASYISRKKVNGKWVYTYKKLGTVRGNGQPVDMTNATPTSKEVSERQRFAQNEAKTRSSISKRKAQQIQSEAESMKRKSVSAQRNVQKSWSYKLGAKKAYYVNKAKNYWKKLTTKYKYRKISIHGSVSVGGNTSSFDTNFYSDKHGNPVTLGKNFIKKYGL